MEKFSKSANVVANHQDNTKHPNMFNSIEDNYDDYRISDSTKHYNVLRSSWISTPIGLMIAISDAKFLYLLEFSESNDLKHTITRLRHNTRSVIIPGNTTPIELIKKELGLYFLGMIKTFETPISLIGSEFQKKAWSVLRTIPYGETMSYKDQAKLMGKPTSYRIVGNANSKNSFAIILPCHRVINSNGNLGGYNGGLNRKKWLLEHEKQKYLYAP